AGSSASRPSAAPVSRVSRASTTTSAPASDRYFRSSVASNARASRIPRLSTSGKLCGGVPGRGLHGVDLANVVNTVQPMERDPLRYGERPEYRMRERAVRHAPGIQRRQQSACVIEEAIQAPAQLDRKSVG